jgi:peptide/nickel transport system substrate-binding protein
MDPAVVYEFGGIQVVGNIYETLVSFDPGDPTIKPLLAKQWDIKDTGDMWTLTFTLDEKATFASGRPVTADDVIFSWSRVLDLNKSPAFLFIDIAQLKKENLRAVDPQTVEVKLPKTASPQVFLSILSFTIGAVVDKQDVMANAGSDMGSTWLNDHSAGSGPYTLERWERSSQTVLSVNPKYWRQPPAIKRVIMRNVGEAANLQSAIETGDADIVQDLGPEQVKVLANNPDVEVVKANSTTLVYLGMNAKSSPLDKVEVREAIRYAINYDEIVNNLLGGNAQLVQEIIPAGLFGHTGSKPFKQDLAKAKALMAQAGVAEGTEVEMLVTAAANAPGGVEWSTLAAKIQSDLQQIGLKITIKAIQQSELLTIYRAQKGQLVLILWGPDFPDPDGNVTPLTNYEAKSIAWRNNWEAPDIAKLSQQAALEQDTAKRADLYKQVVERVLHEGPYAVLYQPTRAFGVRKNIEGFVYDVADTPAIPFWLIRKS